MQIIMTLSVPDKAKVNAKRYVWTLLPRLIEECQSLLPSGFISQHHSAPAHTEKLAQDWTATNCSKFIGKGARPPNLLDVNPIDYYVWRVTELCLNTTKHFYPKPKWSTEEILAANIKPADAGLNQQGHSELHVKGGMDS